MSSQGHPRLTENRKPHTVYLTDEVWSAVERGHLELRLRSPSAPAKIEYIEQLLQAGLGRLSRQDAAPRPSPAAPPKKATDSPTPAAPPPAAPAPSRRPSALERLKQASDPGQPAPIRSVADQP